MTPDKKATERKEYIVKKDAVHTHKGKVCKKGDKIMLTADQAERLKGFGVV